MEKQLYQVVGIRKGLTSKGKPYTVLHVISEFDDYNKSIGCIGQKAENVYIGRNIEGIQLDYIVSFVYGVGFGGKAIVVDVELYSEGSN